MQKSLIWLFFCKKSPVRPVFQFGTGVLSLLVETFRVLSLVLIAVEETQSVVLYCQYCPKPAKIH